MRRTALVASALIAACAGCDLFASTDGGDDFGAVNDAAAPAVDLVPPRWRALASPATSDLYAIWGSGDQDVYAVGASGTILHRGADDSWSVEKAPTSVALYGVWGSGPGDVYLAGDKGTLLHGTGDGRWLALPSPTVAGLRAVWGSGASDVYAVGTAATVVHSRGSGFKLENSQAGGTTFVASWCSGPKDVYALGHEIWHSGGDGVWSPRVNVDHPTLAGMWGDGVDLYIVGSTAADPWNGVILHSHAQGPWAESTQHPAQLRATSGGPSGIIAVGFRADGSGILLRSSGGDDWNVDAVVQEKLYGVFQTSSGRALAVGAGGVILEAIR